VVGFYEDGNEPSVSIKSREFLDWLSDFINVYGKILYIEFVSLLVMPVKSNMILCVCGCIKRSVIMLHKLWILAVTCPKCYFRGYFETSYKRTKSFSRLLHTFIWYRLVSVSDCMIHQYLGLHLLSSKALFTCSRNLHV